MVSEKQAIQRAVDVGREPDNSSATRAAILDGLTVALAGAVHPRVHALADSLGVAGPATGSGGSVASVWFTGRSAPAAQAALLNGMAIHANDFDDTHDAAIVHCMSAILPAALAGVELSGAEERHFFAAVAAGTELACNLSLSRGAYAGWHYTTLCGTIGAALACAIASGAPADVREAAVGNAYVFAAGNKQAVLDSSLMKRLMPGFAAQNGVLAYQAAVSGLDGVDNWLTGQYGLLELFFPGTKNGENVLGGDRARIDELSFKPYPACRFTHGAIEAAADLRARAGDLQLGSGTVEVHYPALDRFGIVCRPYARRGADEMDAQFSTAYLVAETLLNGPITFAAYAPERLGDDRVAELATRVTVDCDLQPADEQSLGPIEVRVGGAVQRIEAVLGSPGRPLSAADHRQKFASCYERYAAQVERIDPKGDERLWGSLTAATDAADAAAEPESQHDLVQLLGSRPA